MKTRPLLNMAVICSAALLTGHALANDINATTHNQAMATANTPRAGGANNTNSRSVDSWMNDYAAAHNGRVTREDFLNEMGERWDAIDTQKRGYLSPSEARAVFGAHPGEPLAKNGAAPTQPAQPGYMGPGSVKGK